MNRAARNWIAPCLAAATLAGCPPAPEAPRPQGPPPAAEHPGRIHYLAACHVCHGVDAKGLENLGPDLITNPFVTGRSDAELLAFVSEGRPADHPDSKTKLAMPPRGGNVVLSDEKILLILEYLRGLRPQ